MESQKTPEKSESEIESLAQSFDRKMFLSERKDEDKYKLDDLPKDFDKNSILPNDMSKPTDNQEDKFPFIKIATEICEDYCGQKPNDARDPKIRMDFENLIKTWFVEFKVDVNHFKDKLKTRKLDQAFKMKEFLDDMKLFFGKELSFEREDHINVILCLHALYISNCDVRREVSVKRTYYDTPISKELKTSSRGGGGERADIVIFGDQKKPLYLLELKVLSSNDIKEGHSKFEFTELSDNNSSEKCSRRVFELVKEGFSTVEHTLAYAFEQARSCYHIVHPEDKKPSPSKTPSKTSPVKNEESPLPIENVLDFMKVPRYGILVGPKMFLERNDPKGYFPIEIHLRQQETEISLNGKVTKENQKVFEIQKISEEEISEEDAKKIESSLRNYSYYEAKEEEKKEETPKKQPKKASRQNTPLKENEKDEAAEEFSREKKEFQSQYSSKKLGERISDFKYSQDKLTIELHDAIDILRVKYLLGYEYTIK